MAAAPSAAEFFLAGAKNLTSAAFSGGFQVWLKQQ